MKDLKQLETIKKKTEGKIELLDQEIKRLMDEKAGARNTLKQIQTQIESLLTDVVVSEHAIIRYFERYLGYNIDEIKQTILPENIKDKIKFLRNCEYPVNGFSIVVKENKVVTLYKNSK